MQIKTALQRVISYGRSNIRKQVLLLVLSCGLLTFLTVGLLFFYTMENTKHALARQGFLVGESVADSIATFTQNRAEKWLQATTKEQAEHIDRELAVYGEDAVYLADIMTAIMSAPEDYRPRDLPSASDSVDIVSGMPHIHYSQELLRQGISEELEQEIAFASNFADSLIPMTPSYNDSHVTFFAASRKGYMICMDIIPESDGTQEVYPTEDLRKNFVENYNPTLRPWYTDAQRKQRLTDTDVYIGKNGILELACAAPYYDSEGFAGVVGLAISVKDIHLNIATTDSIGSNFALGENGSVVFSSWTEGVLAAKPENIDLRETDAPSLAEAARRMVAGENDTMPVIVDGKKYTLAFAPMKKLEWSYGTLISEEEIMAPAVQAREQVRRNMNIFQEILHGIFSSAALQAVLILVPLLLISFYASGWMASRLTSPIQRLTDGVREISEGNLEKKLDIRTGNEIEHLASCFNAMTDDLKVHIEKLSRAAAEKEHIQTELDVAAHIQSGMLRHSFPAMKDFNLYAAMHPARNIGGDFYDFYLIDENHLIVTIADVSGKGIPAALFMAIAKTLLQNNSLMMQNPDDLTGVLGCTNDQLCKDNEESMFVTVFMALLNTETGELRYVNAGHNPPLIQRADGTVEMFPRALNFSLGLMEGVDFVQNTITLSPGDRLFLYTDGVTEAKNEAGEFFAEKRLKEALHSLPPGISSQELLAGVEKAVSIHTGQADQFDDITMLGLVYTRAC